MLIETNVLIVSDRRNDHIEKRARQRPTAQFYMRYYLYIDNTIIHYFINFFIVFQILVIIITTVFSLRQ